MCRVAFRQLHGLGLPTNADTRPPSSSLKPAEIFSLARRHRVLGLLESGLSLSRSWPASEAKTWREACFGQLKHSSERIEEAENLFPFLESRAGPALFIKGPTLAKQAWPDPALRSFDDLDLRIPRQNYDALISIMSDLGYEPEINNVRQRVHLWNYGWGIGFANRQGSIIEFNHRFFPPHYPVSSSFHPQHPGLSGFLKLDHTHVRTLLPHAHLLYACMHALWHGWERLSWLVDIAGLMVKNPSAFDEANATVRRSCFARHALHTGAALAERFFGPGILRAGIEEFVRVRLDAFATAVLSSGSAFVPAAQQRARQRECMSRSEIFSYEFRRALVPGDGDFKAIQLPRAIGWLYWPIRPVRYLAGRSKINARG